MTIVLAGVLFVAVALIVFALVKVLRRKPKKPLRQGDYVMLREKFKDKFPGVPTTYAMVIEAVVEKEAIVVYMTIQNQILKKTIPLYALARAS